MDSANRRSTMSNKVFVALATMKWHPAARACLLGGNWAISPRTQAWTHLTFSRTVRSYPERCTTKWAFRKTMRSTCALDWATFQIARALPRRGARPGGLSAAPADLTILAKKPLFTCIARPKRIAIRQAMELSVAYVEAFAIGPEHRAVNADFVHRRHQLVTRDVIGPVPHTVRRRSRAAVLQGRP